MHSVKAVEFVRGTSIEGLLAGALFPRFVLVEVVREDGSTRHADDKCDGGRGEDADKWLKHNQDCTTRRG